MSSKVRGGRMLNADADTNVFVLTATGTSYTEWYDCTSLAILTTFVKCTYADKSGATLDVNIEFKNEAENVAVDPSSAHSQISADGNNYKAHTVVSGKFRLKVVAGGTFGADETMTVLLDYYGHSN